MTRKKSTKLKQNPNKGFKEKPKLSKNQMILETMSVMNGEIHKLTGEMKAMMNFNATLLEVAEINGLFSTQDVIQLMEANVKNSSVYQMVMTEMNQEITDDIEGLSEILGKQLYDHDLNVDNIRKDIIDFEKFYKGENIDELIAKAEVYRRELVSRQLQENKESQGDKNGNS